MSCERMESRILAYANGRLKESDRAEVQKHLDDCSACRVRATEFSSVSDLLDELPVVEPSPAFDVRVRARIAAEPVKQNWWAWLRPSPRMAFAASMLLLATLFVGSTKIPETAPISPDQVDAEMMQDLSVMEDHDTLSNFEPLKELPPPVDANGADDDQQQM
ncbi:MAG TPA: zf-HC2 domain-containing protein [Candidatus Eisenbacteria bacterium]|jgi:anti-sigma factor RsiW|nr:zf-HC2 domain-containing protein [Candidatus Eisenbacteria bacterium]